MACLDVGNEKEKENGLEFENETVAEETADAVETADDESNDDEEVVHAVNMTYMSSWTEAGIAERFVYLFGEDFKYCEDSKIWMYYDEETGLWAEASMSTMINVIADISNIVETDARENDRANGDDKMQKAIDRFVASMRRAHIAKNALEFAQTKVSCMQDDFDRDARYLGLPGGKALDLVTQTVVKAKREWKLTKKLNGNIKSCVSENFMKFLNTLISDTELLDYLQRYLGSALLGAELRHSSDKHALFLDSSKSDTGKSAILTFLGDALGDYYQTATITLISGKERNGNDASPELSKTVGARIVGISECTSKDTLNAMFKRITGGDMLTTRFLNKNPFEFRPQYKVIVVSNYLPQLHNAEDYAERRRIRRYTFSKSIDRDKQIASITATTKEQDFRDDAITWIVEGCKKYLESKSPLDNYDGANLKESNLPKAMVSAMADYFRENDDVGEFLTSMYYVTNNDDNFVALIDMWNKWQKYSFDKTMTQREFSKQVKDILTRRHELKLCRRHWTILKQNDDEPTVINAWGFTGMRIYEPTDESLLDKKGSPASMTKKERDTKGIVKNWGSIKAV